MKSLNISSMKRTINLSNVDPDARILAIGLIDNIVKVLDTHSGQIHDVDELSLLIMEGPGGFITGHNLYPYIADCQAKHSSSPGFVAQISAVKRHLVKGSKRIAIGVFLPNMVGFRDPNRHRKARYFHCVELTEVTDGVPREMVEVVGTTRRLLQILNDRGVSRWTTSKGGLAARLLRASPEWEVGRHGAPRFINGLAREHMPGNHYGLMATGLNRTVPRAVYLDQDGAHHAAARETPVPHPHHLRERGNARALENGTVQAWAYPNTAVFDSLKSKHYGLFACLVTIGVVPRKLCHMVPGWMQEPGTRVVYLHSNEWWYLTLQWVQLNYVVAAWTATVADPAIPEYAKWAGETAADFRAVKPTLLAAYGMLAVKPDNVSVTYWGGPGVAERGTLTTVPVAGKMRELKWMRDDKSPGPVTANVIARGIIEAETRLRSLMYAWELHTAGFTVVSVYVDGIIIEGSVVPLVKPGWSVKTYLTRLRFLAPNSYVSDEEEKLPGIPKEALDRRRSARSLPVLVRHRERAGLNV